MSITIDMHKSPVLVVRLDTSVLIDMAKIITGKSVQDDQAKRVKRLYDRAAYRVAGKPHHGSYDSRWDT